MRQVEPNLKADDLKGTTPYLAALLTAAALDLAQHALGL